MQTAEMSKMWCIKRINREKAVRERGKVYVEM
jgi:hypothetical protein